MTMIIDDNKNAVHHYFTAHKEGVEKSGCRGSQKRDRNSAVNFV